MGEHYVTRGVDLESIQAESFFRMIYTYLFAVPSPLASDNNDDRIKNGGPDLKEAVEVLVFDSMTTAVL